MIACLTSIKRKRSIQGIGRIMGVKGQCGSAGRPWAENSAEFAGFLTLWPIKKRTDSPRKACRYRGVTAPLSCCFGGHRGNAVLGVARVGPHQDAQGFSRRKGKNRQPC